MSQYLKTKSAAVGTVQKVCPLKKEFTFYDLEGERPKLLEGLYLALLTIRPTSVESERAFSVVNLFCTKQRASLSDKNLSILVFLKFHFKSLE